MTTIQKILIIRLSSLGDILLTTPLLRVLRNRFPRAQIDYVVRKEYSEILRTNPAVTNLYLLDLSLGIKALLDMREVVHNGNYDLILDLHNSIRSKVLRFGFQGSTRTINKRVIRRWVFVKFKWNLYREVIPVPDRYMETAKEFGITNDGKGLELFIPEEVKARVTSVLPDFLRDDTLIIGLCPLARHKTKQWLKERFVETARRLHSRYGIKVMVFGSSAEQEVCKTIVDDINNQCGTIAFNCAGLFSVLETAAAIDKCTLVISNDSGLMHVAAAQKRKLVAIFGPTVREFGFFPYGTPAIVVERKGLHCRPCTHIGRAHCPKRHFRCMTDITVEEVVEACESLLERRRN